MLMISIDTASADVCRLRLEGELVGPWVGELRTACGRVPASCRLTLDLAEVTFVGREGAELLWQLAERGVTLTNPSPFVREQLDAWNRLWSGGPTREDGA